MNQNDKCINYIEFKVTDISLAKAFYGKAFGWSFVDYGPNYCEFSDGHMKGGFEFSEQVAPIGGPLVVLYGNDLISLQNSITDAGGTISKPIFAFPGGKRFHFKDPQGYELAIWSES
jgi:uncharacterized protein